MFRKASKERIISKAIREYIVERQEAGICVDSGYINQLTKYVLRRLKEKENGMSL